jgi:GTPase Era involved in 16S rRNA processing
MFGPSKEIRHRLQKLETHLQNESPLLVDAVKGFRELDRIAYRLGLLSKEQSFATQIPWWPLVSVLGTYSAGKSTFINSYLNYELQDTGNQAVDDKFTVICFSSNEEARTLPGIALDADPRFPFYQMAEELEKVAPGDGARVNAYLQLKTCPSEKLRGYIFIDSPGFDADEQRTSTLKITDYIIDLSDMVLVFFDARHPEVGTMQDTLEHLVSNTVSRKDANKFVYILNQMDATAREDNPEDVIASWQKALSQHGLNAGKFLTVYNQKAASPIENETVRERFENKCEEGMAEINDRIQQVHVDRIYRILGNLDKMAREIEHTTVPRLRALVRQWGRGVLWRDLIAFGLIGVGLLGAAIAGGLFQGEANYAPWLQACLTRASDNIWYPLTGGIVLFIVLFLVHHGMRRLSLRKVLRGLQNENTGTVREQLISAMKKNTGFFHSIFRPEVVGWHRFTRNRLHNLLEKTDSAIQKLNDKFTRPSGVTEPGQS